MLTGLAKAYVDASNAHDLSRIRPMFAANAVYRSSGVGEHTGVDAIIGMMQDFFAANSDVYWDTTDFHAVEESGIEFSFVITLGGISSTGVERLFFNEDNAIRLIEVAR